MKLQKPTTQEKRALKGETNVAALLNALDQRVTEKATLIIVGRPESSGCSQQSTPRSHHLFRYLSLSRLEIVHASFAL